MVVERVARTNGRISAKRLLPVALAAGYGGSARNFRRLVATAKAEWRRSNHRGRRPGVWAPGDMLVIEWGEIGSLCVFCAVLAWSRWRFVFFADKQRAETTLVALARCFEAMGGVPATVLSDGWAASRAAPSPGWWCPPRTMSASPTTTGSDPTSANAKTQNRKRCLHTAPPVLVPAVVCLGRFFVPGGRPMAFRGTTSGT